ncbi:MAG: sigma factor, partial [Actinomycetes bacterium]
MPLDDNVVEAISREHGTALRRFVLSAARDPQLAEDVVQETVLRVWQHAP